MSTNVETIKQEVIDQLSGDSRIDASNIEVTLHEGIVTLSGHVPDLSTRQKAPIAASLIHGVNAVKNNLNVQYLAPHVNDKELQRRVTSSLDWFSGVDAENIAVAVSDGTVSLEGTVGSFMEK